MRWATICRYGGIGDNLVASSVLPGLKRRYDRVEVLTQRPQHVVFENNPYVDKLSVYTKGDVRVEGFADWHYIRAKESAFFANLSHSMEAIAAFFPAQTQFHWPAKARRKFADRSYLEIVHDICDVPYSEIDPNFFPTEEEVALAQETQKKIGDEFIAWVLTGTRIDKHYPYAAFAIARLISELKVPVVMLGAPGKDRELAAAAHADVVKINGSAHNLHFGISDSPENETWPIRRVLTMAQQASLVIGPDTGPLWAVAMRQMPKIVLLSHASATNITKHWINTTALHADPKRVDCWPCHQLHDLPITCRESPDKSGAACISDISTDVIVETARQALSVRKTGKSSGALITMARPGKPDEAVGAAS